MRWRRFDHELQAYVLSVYGYRGECPCGWRAKPHGIMSVARRDLREHLESVHDGNPTKGDNG